MKLPLRVPLQSNKNNLASVTSITELLLKLHTDMSTQYAILKIFRRDFSSS